MRETVVKHSASIQITNTITLLQRRAWNVLLAQAYDELPASDLHRISTAELVEHLGITTRNVEHLEATLRGLVETKVEWNVLGKDGARDWAIMSLLAGVRISGGVVEYSYGGLLRQLLYNPSIYSRIKLSVQNRFGSKHALALYELLVDYLSVGRTPWLSVAEFRHLMGIEEDEYPTFKRLAEKVVRVALLEIAEVSDVVGEVEYRRDGRVVDALQFTCRAKKGSEAETLAAEQKPPSVPALPMPNASARTNSGASTPTRRRRSAPAPTEEHDPFEAWWAALSPLEASAARAEAEAFVERAQPGLATWTKEAMVQGRMRATWQKA